ncbi:hypothetical protein TSUD_215010 [Trifolium subterraneum]|uniref:Uncharacterized protein n=1 Tax=Trifolium subterraneum TaxID=3900 RepID=A0A2Z6N6G2_TRISU|nr:hypothetical protein TSUD_215010 [Trifolium subterraneum]
MTGLNNDSSKKAVKVKKLQIPSNEGKETTNDEKGNCKIGMEMVIQQIPCQTMQMSIIQTEKTATEVPCISDSMRQLFHESFINICITIR